MPLPPCVPSFIPNKGLPFMLLEKRERSVGQEGQAVGKMWNSWQRWLLGSGGQVFKARGRGKMMNYIKIRTFYVTSFHYWFFGNFTPRTLILLTSESPNILLHPCNTPQKKKIFLKIKTKQTNRQTKNLLHSSIFPTSPTLLHSIWRNSEPCCVTQ